MNEQLRNNHENNADNGGQETGWEKLSKVPFTGAESLNKKQENRKEYLNTLLEVSDGINAEPITDAEHSLNLVIEAIGKDGDKYKDNLDGMQKAAKIIDAEMLRRRYEDAYYGLSFRLGEMPEDDKNKQALIDSRDSAQRHMQEAYTLAKNELQKAFPGLDVREASKKFFGFESWGVNPSELTSSLIDGKMYDADQNEISSERNPNNPDRVEKINKAIEIRSNLHGAVYSDEITSEAGVFRKGEV